MQKIRRGIYTLYPKLRIFKEDVEALISIFEKNFEDTETIIDGYKIIKSSDIDLLTKREVYELSIEGKPNYKNPSTSGESMHLELKPHEAGLYLSNKDSVTLRGIEYQIGLILNPRRSKTTFLSNFWWMLLLIIVVTASLVCINQFTPYIHGTWFYVTFFAMLALVSAMWVTFDLKLNSKYSIINLEVANVRTNFFKRKKDDILVGLLVGLTGAILGSILTVVAERLLNPPVH